MFNHYNLLHVSTFSTTFIFHYHALLNIFFFRFHSKIFIDAKSFDLNINRGNQREDAPVKTIADIRKTSVGSKVSFKGTLTQVRFHVHFRFRLH